MRSQAGLVSLSRIFRGLCVIMLLLCAAATTAQAQASFNGVWALNLAATDLAGMTPPKTDVITFTQTADSFAWNEVFTLVNGTTWTESWSGKMDGVARPVVGPANAQASYNKDGSGKWISPEGNSDLFASVSADGKQFILVSTSVLPNGKSLKQRFVYDRTK